MFAAKHQPPDLAIGEHILVVDSPGSCRWSPGDCADNYARRIAAHFVLEAGFRGGDRLRDPGHPVLGKSLDSAEVLAAPQNGAGSYCLCPEDELTSRHERGELDQPGYIDSCNKC